MNRVCVLVAHDLQFGLPVCPFQLGISEAASPKGLPVSLAVPPAGLSRARSQSREAAKPQSCNRAPGQSDPPPPPPPLPRGGPPNRAPCGVCFRAAAAMSGLSKSTKSDSLRFARQRTWRACMLAPGRLFRCRSSFSDAIFARVRGATFAICRRWSYDLSVTRMA
jgi:hypothetical protein